MTGIVQRWISAAILMVWGSALCYMVFSGRVVSYLHPTFQPYTTICGVVLVVLAFALLIVPTAPDADASGCANSMLRTIPGCVIASLVLIVPLLVALRSSPSQFGAAAIMNRGFVDTVQNLPGRVVPLPDEPLPGEDPNVASETFEFSSYLVRNEAGQIEAEALDLLYAAQEEGLMSDFDGQEVEVIGQFFPAKENNPRGNRYNLVRMFMLCCAADAQPIAVPFEIENADGFEQLDWVRITGTATFPVEGGKRIPVIKADHVERTEAPREIFIY